MGLFARDTYLKHNHRSQLKSSRAVSRRTATIPSTASSSAPTYSSSAGTRFKVGRQDEIELDGPLRRNKRNKTSVSYLKKVRKSKSPRTEKGESSLLLKLGWLVCGALFLRLIFMDSGVVDYFKKENILKDKNYQLELTKKENMALEEELVLMKRSRSYQKRIARDHLGVIGPDEYLVLFAKGQVSKSN